jgi:uncharacterized protein (DUF4415 family)
MNAKSKPSPQPWVDPDDAPEITEAWVQQADLYAGRQLVRRGRPKAAVTKEAVKIRLDADVLSALRATGDGWQTRINDMLRASMHLAGRV